MRSLVAIEFLSVDGVMQGLGSPDEDRGGGFEHGGWGARYGAEVQPSRGDDGLGDTSAFLFGRKTYELMAAHWPFVADSDPVAAQLNSAEKYVVTNTMTRFDWHRTYAIGGEVVSAVRSFKEDGDGTVTILGSGVLVRTLIGAGLLDGLRLFVHPLILGSGRRLFDELANPRVLTLVDSYTTGLGTVAMSYRIGAD